MDLTKRPFVWTEEVRRAWRESHRDLTYAHRSAPGLLNSRGTAGAPGRLTHVSETLDPALTDVSSTPDDGLNTFQGRVLGISSVLREEQGVVYTVMVCFDLKTASRLKESRCTEPGKAGSEGVASFHMIVN